MEWIPLTSFEQLDKIDSDSHNAPIVIFKHSTRCSISAMAKSRMDSGSLAQDFPESQAYYLDLLNHRDISNEIEARYRISHESPQLLIIKDGKCVTHTSHGGVKYGFVKDALSKI
ncbi:thioredoxin family protein [Fulvitalea axinellae]|uniref:Thioredoxin family protein n=1 Tax=Fulvitalea axinellae TaxID=1182444 RepID=A0AAU9D8S3_9BACT|nr:thioredoxin family protein [Fulvitalea axinellae]